MNQASTALLAALTLAACGADYAPTQELGKDVAELKRAPSAPTYALKATDAHTAGVTPTWKTSFPIASTMQIFFSTEVTGTLSGHHSETVFVYAPGGSTYMRYDVLFATDVAAGVGEQQAEKTSTGWRVLVSMPVSGTMISQSNLVGGWSATVYIDAATAPNAQLGFTLT